MEISYTEGPMNLNWKQIMQTVAQDDRFYMNTEEDEVTEKEAGWEFLRMYGKDDEEEEEEDDESEFSEEQVESVSIVYLCIWTVVLFLCADVMYATRIRASSLTFRILLITYGISQITGGIRR